MIESHFMSFRSTKCPPEEDKQRRTLDFWTQWRARFPTLSITMITVIKSLGSNINLFY